MVSRYPAAWLDELRSRSDLVQIVSGYVALNKKGRKYWGLCPFHGEKTASFSVDGEQQLYYCFGCKAGGNVFSFLMEMERLSFQEAVEQLAERAHLPVPALEKDEDYERRRTVRERLFSANREAARFYHDNLFSPSGSDSLSYLRGRGLNDSVIRKFGLGAAPAEWSALSDFLLEKGFTLERTPKMKYVIQSRLSGITEEQREVLGCMSVFPGKIGVAELELLMPGMDRLRLLRILEQLQESGLIQETLVGWNVYYRFVHRIYQEYIYEHQSAGKCRQYHQMLGEYSLHLRLFQYIDDADPVIALKLDIHAESRLIRDLVRSGMENDLLTFMNEF